MKTRGYLALTVLLAGGLAGSCSAAGNNPGSTAGSGGGATTGTGTGGTSPCGTCFGNVYTSCESGSPTPVSCPAVCTPDKGCTDCTPGGTVCAGNAVHSCDPSGKPGGLVMACDPTNGQICNQGACTNGCDLAASEPSNVGCEFWAADLDLADLPTDPASAPWGLVLSNAGQAPADVVIEQNDAPLGMPVQTSVVFTGTVSPGALTTVKMPTRELDCGAMPNDHMAPGSCLTSNAFRVTSTVPIVVYQFNNLVHSFSSDASLLIPTTAIGKQYRVVGWGSGHPVDLPGAFVERSYVTVVGTRPNTQVTVKPTWKIRGNGPIAATPAGGTLTATIGPFDVLNLESDDATLQECLQMMKPPYCSDLSGTVVDASEPVVVFSGTEASGVSPNQLGAPTPPTWDPDSGGCCLQHLEEQLFPLDSLGKNFVVTRSPIRSTSGNYEEPDVLRFVGAAEVAEVKTNLPPPMDLFTIQPGEIIDTWTQHDAVVTASAPIMVAQFLVGETWVDGNQKGDPSFTIFPPVEQARTEYVILSPQGWPEAWVVIAAETGSMVSIDGSFPADCIVAPAGAVDGKAYEARRCPLATGVHRLSGTTPFGIMAYGYGDADTYSFPGGAALKKIYDPPPIK